MKTLSPFVHGLSNGASLTTDISGLRFNGSYVRAVSARYARDDKTTNGYIKGQKMGLIISVVIALVALLAAFLAVILWGNEILAIAIIVLWQGLSTGNAFYAIRYERDFIQGKV